LFEQFGRLYNRADRGSGKTKQDKVIKFLAHNPLWVTKATESSIFRDSEATCGTFIVDNMDKLHQDLLKNIEHLIETAWMNDATFRLTDKDTGRTMKFLSYSPMALNNILGLDENTIDKTFEIPMLKSVNSAIKKVKPTAKSEAWEEIRDSIRYWVFENYKDIEKECDNISTELSGREFDVAEVVLTLAKMIDEPTFKEINDYVEAKMQEELVDLENNSSYKVFSWIWTTYFKSNLLEQEQWIFNSDIADNLFDSFNPVFSDEKEKAKRIKGFPKYIAVIVKSVPMFRKTRIIQGRTQILIKKKDLEQYMKLQKFMDEKGQLLGEEI
jgi:hypothetical protein